MDRMFDRVFMGKEMSHTFLSNALKLLLCSVFIEAWFLIEQSSVFMKEVLPAFCWVWNLRTDDLSKTITHPSWCLTVCFFIKHKSVYKKTNIWMFIASLVIILKNWNQFKYPPTDDWINKVYCVYIMEYYSIIKNKKCITDTMQQ